MEESEDNSNFTPRDYQVQLMEIALRQNTIIYLPTGTGKTYIALMVLKRLSGDLNKSYLEGGKISFILVNTTTLVGQHTKYIADHTVFRVRGFSGEMNVDGYRLEQWEEQFEKHQVLVMTAQILDNIINNSFIDLKRVNLIIFDECHRGVDDHAMRQIMMKMPTTDYMPQILGLTATLLNGNCKNDKVIESVLSLETTFRSKVATVDALQWILGYSTNPRELFKVCHDTPLPNVGIQAIERLEKCSNVLDNFYIEQEFNNKSIASDVLEPMQSKDALKSLRNLITDLQLHIQMMGLFGGQKACIAHMIQIERIKKHCTDNMTLTILNSVQTTIGICSATFANYMAPHADKIYKFSSDKMLKLFEILRDFKTVSKEPLCALIFVQRRFTAKIIHHVLDNLRVQDEEFAHIKSNFMVGTNNRPFDETCGPLYISKKNRQVLNSFADKEFNVLVASNVLEEGVDIPMCTLVVKFDKALDYRSYIQSKGRARHKASFYYTIVEAKEQNKFAGKYQEFQKIEKMLSEYLVGKNELREGPASPTNLNDDDLLPPYFVNGPGSAQVNMISAISLLSRYCLSLPSDKYTVYGPDWYLERNMARMRVVIALPIVCPILEPIVGPWAHNKKAAKRAAALIACIALHKCGELDDDLLPKKKKEINEEDVEYLFKAWPEERSKKDGNKKTKRLHQKVVADCVAKPISTRCFLHIIDILPKYSRGCELEHSIMYDMYKHELRFGLITSSTLPPVPNFPLYDSMGELEIVVRRNVKSVELSQDQIEALKQFHFLVFNDVLEVLKPFLLYDNSGRCDSLLVVPVKNDDIQFDVVAEHKTIRNKLGEPSITERTALEVDEDAYLNKIVSPWYRNQPFLYIVTRVYTDKSPRSKFPNDDFTDFTSYYREKHNLRIVKEDQPLLMVRGLTNKLNTFKPRGLEERKRKKNARFEELAEYLVPELVVKQDFPSSLWIQSRFLPCILSRLTFLLRLRQLQTTIGKELHLKVEDECPNLKLDEHLLDYEPRIKVAKEKAELEPIQPEDQVDNASMLSKQYNKDFIVKMMESEYSWKNIDEPKDIERELDVTVMEIEHYEQFINRKVPHNSRLLHCSSPKKVLPAITYEKEFAHKPIQTISVKFQGQSPDLSEFYQALCTSEANDIVNLERLETLGDSLLKYLISVYVSFKFPDYNEGKLTTLKGRLVSNRNFYYLANAKHFGGILKNCAFSPKDEWVPPCFAIPETMSQAIDNRRYSVTALFDCVVSTEEAISGQLQAETLEDIVPSKYPINVDEENSYHNMCHFLNKQYVADKSMADAVEALLGAFLQRGGIPGATKFIEWIGIIPKSEAIQELLARTTPNPILNPKATAADVDFHIPQYHLVEERLGYRFKNRAFLLQALTHSSYSPNRITLCYERLEFLGDALLDFLLTCYIYEYCGYLTPGKVTDLRSALVNNNTFASLTVRCGFHKFLLMINAELQRYVDRFANYLEAKNYVIDDEVLILLEEDDLNLAEYVDVPKILGDVFEALIGAVYLDSGKDLEQVWAVIYKIMWKEIDLFSNNVPINVVRRLFEAHTAHAEFSKSKELDNKKTMVCLDFMCDGRKKRVHGFGSNKAMAKRAAAKIALRSIKL